MDGPPLFSSPLSYCFSIFAVRPSLPRIVLRPAKLEIPGSQPCPVVDHFSASASYFFHRHFLCLLRHFPVIYPYGHYSPCSLRLPIVGIPFSVGRSPFSDSFMVFGLLPLRHTVRHCPPFFSTPPFAQTSVPSSTLLPRPSEPSQFI